MKVRNMEGRTGRLVANQFIIIHNGETFFQSYNSVIVKCGADGITYLDECYWDYSATTGKYRNQFLCEGIAETRKKIDSGQYKLANLN